MASLMSRPLPVIRLIEDEGSSLISEVYWPDSYLSNSDTPRYEVINLEPEYDSTQEEASSSTGGTISGPIEGILRHFRFLNATVISPFKVRDYLYRYPELVELLEYVVQKVYDHFNSDIQLSLEMYHDKETLYESLILYIRQYEYSENIMNVIKEIRRGYRQKFPKNVGNFLLTTDFHLPG